MQGLMTHNWVHLCGLHGDLSSNSAIFNVWPPLLLSVWLQKHTATLRGPGAFDGWMGLPHPSCPSSSPEVMCFPSLREESDWGPGRGGSTTVQHSTAPSVLFSGAETKATPSQRWAVILTPTPWRSKQLLFMYWYPSAKVTRRLLVMHGNDPFPECQCDIHSPHPPLSCSASCMS